MNYDYVTLADTKQQFFRFSAFANAVDKLVKYAEGKHFRVMFNFKNKIFLENLTMILDDIAVTDVLS